MPDFEIDIKKVNWTPKHVVQVAEVASRALEASIHFEELEVVGTDHIERIPLRSDDDIPRFLGIKAKTRFHESVIRFKLPERIVGEDFTPKKNKILAKGKRMAKFFGDCQVSTRQVEFTLKLFDCGHFYLKQTLPGSGASPYWVIFEGRWERTEKGLSLEYLLRYSWQITKGRPSTEFAIEAVPAAHRSRLAWSGDAVEQQLNGSVPAIVGEAVWCWVEVCREPDVVENTRARFNKDADDAPVAQEPDRTSKDRCHGPGAAEQQEQARQAALVSETLMASKIDEEPIWPLLLGCGLFLALFISFTWHWWVDRTEVDRGGA